MSSMNDLSLLPVARSPLAMPAEELVAALKAAAEPTRLRILLLLRGGELSVKDLTLILGQSQPRLSRHLKLLVEAGLVERFREGSWVYFHLSDRTEGGRLAQSILAVTDAAEPRFVRDRERAEALKREREQGAQRYFDAHAGEWDELRCLHASESHVEAAIVELFGAGPYRLLVDLGTGTGRMLEILAGRFERALGLDLNQSMLAYARSRVDRLGLSNIQVRHGNLYDLSVADGEADVVVMHQVLHYLSEPQGAIAEAARVLRAGGRLLIVDFAPHDLEFLREEHAHERLGFATETIAGWLVEAGLLLTHSRDLAGGSGNEDARLTVSLWLAEKPPGPFNNSQAV
ncbi:MAG: metalloregulator ArsR/SmtB family transcription factor [Hyphomicrobiaceae bacterium]|nr:metalloregulator ArsR/SmtB family transcription factor [Hyphomicrobiaceae bacterium]